MTRCLFVDETGRRIFEFQKILQGDRGKNIEITRKLEVSRSIWHPEIVLNVRGEMEEDGAKSSSKTKSLSAWPKRSDPKLNWEKALFDCLIVFSFGNLVVCCLCYVS